MCRTSTGERRGGRQGAASVFGALLTIASCFSVPHARGDESAATQDSAAPETQVPHDVRAAPAAYSSSEKPVAPPVDVAGLYLGRILALDAARRFIYVVPASEGVSRKRFYLDQRTLYRRGKKRAKFSDLDIGTKVAIRFFARDDLAIADGIFIVEGEFNPSDYKMPAKKVLKKEGGGGHEQKEGGHGDKKQAAPKAEKKPSGGHH